MAAEIDHQKKHSTKIKALRAGAGAGGGIIVIGGALLAAAISAAFVAHRARRSAGGKSRDRGDAADSKSESEGSEGGRVWPEEVIDRRSQSPELDAGSVEIQETSSNYSELNAEIKENPTGPSFVVDGSDGNQEDSYTDVKDSEAIIETTESQLEGNAGDFNCVTHVGGQEEEDETEFQAENSGEMEEDESEGSMLSDVAENLVDSAKEAEKVREEEMKYHVDEESETEGAVEFDSNGICPYEIVELEKASESLKDVELDVDRIGENGELGEVGCPSSGSLGHGVELSITDSVADGDSDIVKLNMLEYETSESLTCSEMIHFEAESVHDDDAEGDYEQQGSSSKSIEELRSHLEEENEQTHNPSTEFECLSAGSQGHGVELSISDSVADGDSDIVNLNMPDDETSENLTCSEIIDLEAKSVHDDGGGDEGDYEQQGASSKSIEEVRSPIEEENEQTRDPSTDFDGQGVCAAEPAGLDNEMKQNQTIENTHKNISGDNSLAEEMRMYSDPETEESKQTFENSETVMEMGESQPGADEASEFLQDTEESDVSHVKEEEEQGGVKDPPEGSQEQDTELYVGNEEDGQPSTENEMKLQFEPTTKTTGKEEDEVVHESETVATGKERRMDFVLIGSPKALILVLALALAVGLIAFFHHDQIRQHNHGIPEIYDKLYELFFRSYNRAIGEL